MKPLLYTLFTLALLLNGCSTTHQEVYVPTSALDGTWKSTNSNAIISFDKGVLSGNDGCNHFVTHYTTNNNTLSITGNMMSTMMACSNMESSNAFKNNLHNAKLFENNGTLLKLMSAQGTLLGEFKALSKTPTEGKYTIHHLNNNKQAIITLNIPIVMNLNEGKMSGNTGCNDYATTYTIKNDTIVIGFPATTRKMCSPEIMEQEQNFINALQKSVKLSRNSERWEFRDTTNALQFSMMQE